MILNKLKRLIEEYRQNHKNEMALLQELDWANIYHDSIRGKQWLQNLPLNVGRWAGNYTFFYILNRVLSDCRPNSILEFGLGESSKFISTYLDFYLKESSHLVIEQDVNWLKNFKSQFQLSDRTKIELCDLKKVEFKGFQVNVFDSLENKINNDFDLYIVDGPMGSPRYFRYDIVSPAEPINTNHQFIILLDDYERQGEKDTFFELESIFKSRGIVIYSQTYFGQKLVKVIVTEKYKFCCSF